MENEIEILAVEKMMNIEVGEVKLETAEMHSGSLGVEPITWRLAIKDDNNENTDKMILNRLKKEHNYVKAWIECDVSNEELLEMEDKIIKLEKDLDCGKFVVNGITEEFIIKDENGFDSSMDANSVLNRISPAIDTPQFQTKSSAIAKFDVLFEGIKNEHNYVKAWIECHVSSEEFLEMEGRIIKLDKDLDCGKFEANEITEEFIIKDENYYDSSMDANSVLNRISSECDEIEDEGNFIPTVMAGKTKELVVQIERLNLEMFMNINNCPAIDTPQFQTKSSVTAKFDVLFKGASKRKIPRKRHHRVCKRARLKLFSCYNCDYTTCHKYHLIEHMKNHRNQNGAYSYSPRRKICMHYKVTFRRKKNFDSHLIRKHPDIEEPVPTTLVFECKHCTYKNTEKDTFARHMLEHSKRACSFYKRRMCMHCDATYRWKLHLDEHTIKKHPDFISSVSNKIYECTHCTYQTVIKSLFATHMLKHPETAYKYKYRTCKQCDAKLKTKQTLDEHTVRKHPDFMASVSCKIHECMHCMFKTIIKSNLAKHMLKHSKTESYNLRSCMHCDATLKSKTTLDEHIVRKHPDFMASVSRKIHECTHCMFKTTLKYNFAIHMLKHSMCMHCDATFKSKKRLDEHIVRKHPDFMASVSYKIHQCTYCMFKTTLKSNLAIHMLKHSTCMHCDATFKSKKKLDEHIVRKHPDFMASVSCKIHQCTHCMFKTTLKSNLAIHVLKHSTCMHCDVTFTAKSSLDEHTIRQHPDFIASVSSKIYKCTHCTYQTVVKTKFAGHIMLKHPETASSYN